MKMNRHRQIWEGLREVQRRRLSSSFLNSSNNDRLLHPINFILIYSTNFFFFNTDIHDDVYVNKMEISK